MQGRWECCDESEKCQGIPQCLESGHHAVLARRRGTLAHNPTSGYAPGRGVYPRGIYAPTLPRIVPQSNKTATATNSQPGKYIIITIIKTTSFCDGSSVGDGLALQGKQT